jgi:hypothetical protein
MAVIQGDGCCKGWQPCVLSMMSRQHIMLGDNVMTGYYTAVLNAT